MFPKMLGTVVCLVVLAPGTSVFAQELSPVPLPLVEVSAGYAYMRDTTIEENFPAGWYFSAGTNLTRWFGVTGEVTGAHKKLADEPFLNVKANLYTFMGGPRFFVKRGRVVPFAQFLAGAAHLRAKATVPIQGVPSVTESDTQFAFQPGAGLTVLLTRNVGVRAAVDYRRIIFNETDDDEDNSEVRGIVGVVFGWGAR